MTPTQKDHIASSTIYGFAVGTTITGAIVVADSRFPWGYIVAICVTTTLCGLLVGLRQSRRCKPRVGRDCGGHVGPVQRERAA